MKNNLKQKEKRKCRRKSKLIKREEKTEESRFTLTEVYHLMQLNWMKRKENQNSYVYSSSQNYQNIEKLLGKFGQELKVNKISREYEVISKFRKIQKSINEDKEKKQQKQLMFKNYEYIC